MLHAFLERRHTAVALLALGLGLTSSCAHRRNPQPAQPAQSQATLAPAAASTPTAAPTAAEPAPAPAAGAAKLTSDVPTACSGDPGSCVPPASFANKLCKTKYPDLALLLFGKSMPWQHMWVKAEHVEPVNVYAGPTDEQWLQFGEEVLIISRHKTGTSKGVVQTSGPQDVDILRIDGTCATIRQEMLVTYNTGEMKSPYVVWKYLDSAVQQALLTEKAVLKASEEERKVCKSSSVTHPQDACDKAMKVLTQAIVSAVKKGVALPTPEKRPEWGP